MDFIIIYSVEVLQIKDLQSFVFSWIEEKQR